MVLGDVTIVMFNGSMRYRLAPRRRVGGARDNS